MKNETVGHTPTPWKVDEGFYFNTPDGACARDINGYHVFEAKDKETCEQIIKAVNSHEALISALKLIAQEANDSLSLSAAERAEIAKDALRSAGVEV